MLTILREYIEGEFQVKEYTKDGVSISHTIRQPISSETPVTLEDVKKQKTKELQHSYYASFTTFQSSALGSLKTYPIDAEAQGNLKDYQDRLIADPNKDTFYFKTIEDGNLVLHTRTQFLQLMADAEMFKVQQTQKFNNLAQQVNTATTVEEVNAIVW